MGWMKDETGLEKRAANFVPLSPLSHLRRAVQVFPNHEALVYGSFRKTYAEYHARVSQLASALAARGVAPGDVVATVMPNVPAQAEALFGVPACGATIVPSPPGFAVVSPISGLKPLTVVYVSMASNSASRVSTSVMISSVRCSDAASGSCTAAMM